MASGSTWSEGFLSLSSHAQHLVPGLESLEGLGGLQTSGS